MGKLVDIDALSVLKKDLDKSIEYTGDTLQELNAASCVTASPSDFTLLCGRQDPLSDPNLNIDPTLYATSFRGSRGYSGTASYTVTFNLSEPWSNFTHLIIIATRRTNKDGEKPRNILLYGLDVGLWNKRKEMIDLYGGSSYYARCCIPMKRHRWNAYMQVMLEKTNNVTAGDTNLLDDHTRMTIRMYNCAIVAIYGTNNFGAFK